MHANLAGIKLMPLCSDHAASHKDLMHLGKMNVIAGNIDANYTVSMMTMTTTAWTSQQLT